MVFLIRTAAWQGVCFDAYIHCTEGRCRGRKGAEKVARDLAMSVWKCWLLIPKSYCRYLVSTAPANVICGAVYDMPMRDRSAVLPSCKSSISQ